MRICGDRSAESVLLAHNARRPLGCDDALNTIHEHVSLAKWEAFGG